MRQMQKVLWLKGVLLTPQHLQLQDRFLEDLFGFQLGAHTFSPWGFSRLEIDREALSAGTFAVTAAAGILPDRLPFEIPGPDPAPAPKPLAGHWRPDQESLQIYLAIPEQRPGQLNIATGPEEKNTRYLAEIVVRRDENTGLAEKPIQVARKNFRFLIEGESMEGSATLPIARVIRSAAGDYQLDPRFIPPLLDLTASDYLISLVRRLVEILSARSSSLSGARRQRNQGLADFGVADVANFWLLYTVNTHLPRFRHILETRRGHPAELYAALLELAGALTTFSPTLHPRALPEYDHADLGGCFTVLDEMVRELLETVVPTNHATLPLRQTEPSIYATAIDQDRYLSAPQLYLAMSAEIKQDELARRVPSLIKVGAADQVERLIRQALPGVGLRHLPTPPSALPIKSNYQYFLIDRTGAEWEAIQRARNLAVYLPADFPEPRLELVILLPAPGR